ELAGKPEEARQNHAKNPVHRKREAILKQGEFHTYAELYFAVADTFVSWFAHAPPDTRWQALFEKAPRWSLGDINRTDVNSYRTFSLGLLALSSGRVDEGNRLVMAAAKQRIDNFETVIRANFEGFQIASIVDKIVIDIGLAAAMQTNSSENANLVLRGSEIV